MVRGRCYQSVGPRTMSRLPTRPRAIATFLKLQAATYTPSDSPSRSPETCAIESLQAYCRDMKNYFYPLPFMSLAEYLRLTAAVQCLLVEHVITTRLALTIAGMVANRFMKSVP